MPMSTGQSAENVQALKGLIGWFNQSSVELIQEYRRLEEQAAHLKGQLKAKHQELEHSLREREEARAYLLSVLESLKAARPNDPNGRRRKGRCATGCPLRILTEACAGRSRRDLYE